MIIITAIILTFLFFCWYIAHSSSKKKAALEIERINRVAQREKENARISAMMMAKNTYYSSSYGSHGSSKNKPTAKTYSPTMKANTTSYSRNRNSYTSDDGDSMMMVNSVISSLSNSSYDSPSSSSFSCDTSSSSSSSSSCDSGGSSSSDD